MTSHPAAEYMERAVTLALEAVRSGAGGPFGAVIVRGSRIIATGYNQVPSTKDPTAHAEIVAIRAACRALDDFRLKGCVLYSSCEPCPMCLAAALWSRLDAVYYSADRRDAAAAGFDDSAFHAQLAGRSQCRLLVRPFLEGRSREAFEAWLARADRQPY